ncbi:MAG: hypothetical protein FJ291_07760 [Planctomycetes bacterium]|nr:hypothetical protein [Planctomycetota bacterium]
MTPEQLTERLGTALPSALRAVVLYGSAAAGDHVAGKSDYNVLVVVSPLGKEQLDALAPPAQAWAGDGHRPPLLFTPEQLAASADAFPIELLDIQRCRRLLFGKDPLAGVSVAFENLRLELERELKAKLLALRESYLLAAGKPKRVAELLAASLSSFLVLFRAALRLYQDEVPMAKLDALRALADHLGFDPTVFLTVQLLKEGRLKPREVSPPELFAEYLAAIEGIVEAVDRRIRKEAQ